VCCSLLSVIIIFLLLTLSLYSPALNWAILVVGGRVSPLLVIKHVIVGIQLIIPVSPPISPAPISTFLVGSRGAFVSNISDPFVQSTAILAIPLAPCILSVAARPYVLTKFFRLNGKIRSMRDQNDILTHATHQI
jgi:hypothetical protein